MERRGLTVSDQWVGAVKFVGNPPVYHLSSELLARRLLNHVLKSSGSRPDSLRGTVVWTRGREGLLRGWHHTPSSSTVERTPYGMTPLKDEKNTVFSSENRQLTPLLLSMITQFVHRAMFEPFPGRERRRAVVLL